MILNSQGPIYMGVYDATNGKAPSGYLTGLVSVGCANSELSTSLTRSTKKIKESCSGQRLDLTEIETEKSGEVVLTMTSFDKKMLATALFGTHTNITGSTVTAEAFPTVAVGDFVSLKYTDVSSVVIKDSAGTPATLTLGTHYEITSAGHGIIKILNLAAFTQPLKADYSYAAQGNITAFTSVGVERGIIYQGLNTNDNKQYRVVIPRVSFALDGKLDWLSNEEVSITLKGSMLYVEPYASDTVQGPFMRVSGALVV